MQITIPIPSNNWKTSLVGLLSLAVSLIRVVTDAHGATYMAALSDPTVWVTMLVAVIGFLAKDGDVTGGTRGQPSTEAAIINSNHAPAVGAAAPAPADFRVDLPQPIASVVPH